MGTRSRSASRYAVSPVSDRTRRVRPMRAGTFIALFTSACILGPDVAAQQYPEAVIPETHLRSVRSTVLDGKEYQISAQDTLARPVAALHLGFGGNYGWLGVGGEAYLQRGRLSVLAGLGIAPWGPTVAGAAGVRYYLVLGATPHRLFGDLSVSLMGLSQPTLVPGALVTRPLGREYGPGVSIGYSYLARSGFTLTAGGGVGTPDLGSDFDLVPVVHIGAGWTWRR